MKMMDKYFDSCDHSKYEHDKLRILLNISTELNKAKTFDEIGQILFRNLNCFSSGRLPVGIKFGILDYEKNIYTLITNSLTYVDQDEIIPEPEKYSCPINEVKYFSKYVIDTKKTLFLKSNHSELALKIFPDGMKVGAHSMLFVPLLYEDELLGLISFAREPENSIPEDFVEFFESIAQLISIKVKDLILEQIRKEREYEITESEKLYRSLVELSPDAIALTDLNLNFLLCNDNLAELLKIPDKRLLINTNALIFFHQEEHKKLFDGIENIKNSKRVINREYRIIRQDKVIINCEFDVSLIKDKNGKPKYLLALIRDITQKKKQHDELLLNEKRLEGLLEINKSSWKTEKQIIDIALDYVIKLTKSEFGFISILVNDGKSAKIVSWSSVVSEKCKLQNEENKFIKIVEQTLWQKAISDKKAIFINDYANYEFSKKLPEDHLPINRVMVLPVFDGESIVLLGVLANKSFNYDEADSKQATIILFELWRIIQNKQYLQAVQETRELFKNLVETVNDWIFEIDKDGIITYSSPRSKDIVGVEATKLIGRNSLEFLSEEDRKKVLEIFESEDIKKGKSVIFENVLYGADGSKTYLESSIIPFFDTSNNLKGYRIITRDVSMRRYYETKIERMEHFYKAIVEDQTELIVRFTQKGTITFVNNSFCKYFNRTKEDFIGNNLFSFLPDEYRDILYRKIQDVPGDKSFLVSLHRERKPDGKLNVIEWIHHPLRDSAGNIIEFQSVGRDISKQKEFEEQLEEKNKLIERILHTNPNTIYIYSLITGETKFISQNVYYYLGYTDEELISLKNYIGSMLIHPEDREKLRRNIEKIKNLKDGEIVVSEHRVKHKEGDWIWLMTFESVFKRDENGNPIEVIGSSIDITETIRIRNELINYKNNLEKLVSERTNKLMIINKSLEEEIRERKITEQNLIKSKLILDSIGDGVFTINKDCIITSFNKAAERITGFSADTALGSNCHNIFRVLETDIKLENIIDGTLRLSDKLVHIRNKKGDLIPVSFSTYILYQQGSDNFEVAITFRDQSQVEILRKELDEKYSFQDIVAKSAKFRQLFSILPDIAQSDSAVLIEGETGTGKELFAKAIFNLSKRKDKPFVTVNCAAIPPNLLESELFGYMKGSFTDAKQDKKGKVLLADGGTLFLDEIGELPLPMQSKLLRLLENYEFEPIGALKPQKVDIRVIAATNRNLKELVEQQDFRADLYFRLNTVKLVLPPLRDRKEDIPYLVDHFISRFKARFAKEINGIDTEVLKIFYNYSFPGNIRELEKIIEYAFIICDKGRIELSHLPPEILNYKVEKIQSNMNITEYSDLSNVDQKILSLLSSYIEKSNSHTKKYISQMSDIEEKNLIIETLKKYKGNKSQTAKELNMHYTTLWKKLKKYKLTDL